MLCGAVSSIQWIEGMSRCHLIQFFPLNPNLFEFLGLVQYFSRYCNVKILLCTATNGNLYCYCYASPLRQYADVKNRLNVILCNFVHWFRICNQILNRTTTFKVRSMRRSCYLVSLAGMISCMFSHWNVEYISRIGSMHCKEFIVGGLCTHNSFLLKVLPLASSW